MKQMRRGFVVLFALAAALCAEQVHPVTGRHIAQVAERRFLGTIRPLPLEPIYVDPPEAKLPGSKTPSSPATT